MQGALNGFPNLTKPHMPQRSDHAMKNSHDDTMLGALAAGTDLPEDIRRTLGLSADEMPSNRFDGLERDDPEGAAEVARPEPAARRPARKPIPRQAAPAAPAETGKPVRGGASAKLGTAGRLKIDVETLRRDSTHQLGHVIDEAIAFRLKRAVFEQKMTRGAYRTERAVIEAALLDWLDRYDAGDLAEAA